MVLWGWWVGVGRSWFVRQGLWLGGGGWSVVVCAFGFGVGGLGLVGRSLGGWVEMVSGGLCCWIWGWWVGVGWAWVVLEGLGWVGWAWSVVVCAFRFGVGGLGLVGRGLCLQVWHGWVGVGQWWFGLQSWWIGAGRYRIGGLR